MTDGESDYLQVTVRLLHADGSAFVASEYSDVTLGYATGSGATISTAHGGQHDYLVLSGTRAQVNAALAGPDGDLPEPTATPPIRCRPSPMTACATQAAR